MKKVKVKRKRATKADPDEEKKATDAAAEGPAVEPAAVTQDSQDIVPVPNPQLRYLG